MAAKNVNGRKVTQMEALHIVACSLNAVRMEKQFGAGSTQHNEALELERECIRIWRSQLWNKRQAIRYCPHCKKEI